MSLNVFVIVGFQNMQCHIPYGHDIIADTGPKYVIVHMFAVAHYKFSKPDILMPWKFGFLCLQP